MLPRTSRQGAGILAAALALAAAACLGTGTARVDAPCREMRSAVAYEMLKDSPTIPVLDVRLPSEVTASEGRLQRGLAMPLDRLPWRLQELERFKTTTIVVLGKDAESGRRACQLLSSRGFEYVIFVSDGAEGWFRNAFPGAAAPPMATPSPTPTRTLIPVPRESLP